MSKTCHGSTKLSGCFLLMVLSWGPLGAQVFDEKFEHWPLETTIKGRVLVDNGIMDLTGATRILKRVAQGKRILFFENASTRNPVLIQGLRQHLGEDGKIEIRPIDATTMNSLRAVLKSHDVVVLRLGSSAPDLLASLKPLRGEFKTFLREHRSLILDGPTSRVFGIAFANNLGEPKEIEGLNLLPDCLIGLAGPTQADRRKRFDQLLEQNPKLVGVHLEPNSLLMVSGRKVTVYGKGKATFKLSRGTLSGTRIQSITERESRRQRPAEFLIDLTEWRRDAIDRTIDVFPPKEPGKPFVVNGTLVIVGGGGIPQGLMERFVALAGGVKNAKLVYIPCSEDDKVSSRQRMVQNWTRMGVKSATLIHTKDRNRANSDEAFLEPLKTATGIWFGGGRQWNFSDSYYGTQAHKLMKDVLARGGVIGGSSAGASIQGRYLARATPIGNWEIMAPGYERGGLGFIAGVAIDQHFAQRNRFKDLSKLVGRHPQLLGIGIDESTALIVQKSRGEVVGRGQVHFYDRRRPVLAGKPDYFSLADGQAIDLAERKIVSKDTTLIAGKHTNVMSFNIRYANDNDGKNRWANRKELVLTRIRECSPDLLGIQEALKTQVDFLRESLPGYSFLGTGRRKDATGEYVPIFYRKDRYTQVGAGHFWHSKTPDVRGSKSWDSSLPRMVTWVLLSDKENLGQKVLVANTHFDHKGNSARANSAHLIRKRLLDANPGVPFVLMGDFNAKEGSKPYDILLNSSEPTTSNLRLVDSYRSIHQIRTDEEATYQGFSNSREGNRIDWILHSHHWQTLQARIVYNRRNEAIASDHYPVVSLLKLK